MIESAAIGILLGILFYAGLWWTVRKALAAQQPALWFLASLLLRTTLLMGAFLWVGQGQLSRMLACLVGFQLAHLGVTRGVRACV